MALEQDPTTESAATVDQEILTTHSFLGELSTATAYGENRWQQNAGLYAETGNNDPLALHNFELQQGSEPSYNNYCDIDRMLQTVSHIAAVMDKNYSGTRAIAVGVKHGNACGAAEDDDPREALIAMLNGDPRAIFGGAIMCNFPLDEQLAQVLMTHGVQGKRLLDVVVAPEVTPEALEILQRKEGKLRVMTNPALQSLTKDSLDVSRRDRYVRGGRLVQPNYTFLPELTSSELQRNGEAAESVERDLLLAWAIGSTSNSNTVTLVKDGMLIGNGVGQQDRVSAAELAIKRAQDASHVVEGAVAYSDSFFPFPDGPMVLAGAGVKAILATRGSVRDGQIVQALQEAGVTLYTLPDDLARGFYAH